VRLHPSYDVTGFTTVGILGAATSRDKLVHFTRPVSESNRAALPRSAQRVCSPRGAQLLLPAMNRAHRRPRVFTATQPAAAPLQRERRTVDVAGLASGSNEGNRATNNAPARAVHMPNSCVVTEIRRADESTEAPLRSRNDFQDMPDAAAGTQSRFHNARTNGSGVT